MRKFNKYKVVFSDSEHIGLFAGILLRAIRDRPRHVLLAHHLTPRKKHAFMFLAKEGVDQLIVHSPAQRDFAISRLGVDPASLVVLPYQVDTTYWTPEPAVPSNFIVTAGLECRDYETLIEAVEDLPLKVYIGAASNWSRKSNTLADRPLPANITASSYSYRELRSLYARSLFVVVPLLNVDFQAGITTILEAMAMQRAVILTRTMGQSEVISGPMWTAEMNDWPSHLRIEQSSGIYVTPRDAAGLRSAIKYLQNHPEVAAVLGANGRAQVEANWGLEAFTARFADVIRNVAASGLRDSH
jgi:glycosyltransferase involved in cell wall biosynthesis